MGVCLSIVNIASRKAVIIDVRESVGEVASKIWPVVKFFYPFLG